MYKRAFLQNHIKYTEFPVDRIDNATGSSDIRDPFSTLLAVGLLFAMLASVVMLVLFTVLHFTQWIDWPLASFHNIAKSTWWATLALFVLTLIRLATRTNPAKKEQKLYYKLTQATWLPREKREGLRLDLFSAYESRFWSETLEYYPLQWRIAKGGESQTEKFQVLYLAPTQNYIDSLQKWWDISSASALKFMIEKLLKGLHAPLFERDLYNNPTLLQSLSAKTGFSIAGIENTLRSESNYPAELIWAFDLSRAVSIARDGFMAQYLTEEEAWHYILRAKDKAYEIFQSDRDFFNNYMLGYAYWQTDFDACQARMADYHKFQNECPWPMKRLRWNNY